MLSKNFIQGEPYPMRKILTLTAAALSVLALAGCTQNSSQPKPSPAATCTPQAPTVPKTVKAGATLKVKGLATDCAVKFSSKNRLVNLSLKDSHGLVLASSSTQASANGAYTATFAVPSLVSGKATVSLDSGFARACTGSKCAPLQADLTIQKVALRK